MAKKQDTTAAISKLGGKSYLEKGQYGTEANSFKQTTDGANLLDLIIKHPLVRACNKIKVNSVLKVGSRFTDIPKDTEKVMDALEFTARIDLVQERILWQLVKSNSYYGEIVVDGNKLLKSIRTIDSKYMEHDLDEKGNVVGYIQVLQDFVDDKKETSTRDEISRTRGSVSGRKALFDKGVAVHFELSEILYIADNFLDSSSFAHAELLTLREALYNIDLIEKFITWMFESNQFRTAIRIPASMQPKAYEEYVAALQETMGDPTGLLLLKGDTIQYSPLRQIEGFDQLLKILDYYRSQVLSLTQVTPIQVSLTGDSNRSSSDTQYRYVNYDDIRAKERLLGNAFRFDLFPKIGLKGARMIWNPIDIIEEKQIIDNATLLLNMNTKKEVVEEYMIEKGIDIEKGSLEEPEPVISDKPAVIDKNSDLQPSRKKQEKQLEDMGRKE